MTELRPDDAVTYLGYRLEDLSREELIAAVRNLARLLREANASAERALDMLGRRRR